MTWTVLLIGPAKKQFQKLPDVTRRRIHDYLRSIEQFTHPRLKGKQLVGKPPRWCYRVGDHRIICDIRDSELIVMVIESDHRSTIYR